MANEIWGPIKTPIKNQIELRQKLMSQNSNYKQRMTYLNKKCDIRVTPLSYDLTNENTYSNFIFNNDYIEGVIENSYKSKTEKPFVENFELENRTGGNDKVGVIRTGKMSIKIFTREQFNLIEKYFRIGSAILIEWGWGSYVLSGGSIEYFKTNLYNENAIKNTRILNENDILSHIETKTLESEGNYDAAIMFITNFNVNFENGVNDFYYTLNIDFVGKSLLLNELVLNKAENDNINNNESSKTDEPEKIFSNKLINLLRFIEIISDKNTIPEETIRRVEDSVNLTQTIGNRTNDIIGQTLSKSLLEENQTNEDELKKNLYTPKKQSSISEERGTFESGKYFSTNIYSYNFITLEYFLKLIERNINPDLPYNSLDQRYIIPIYPHSFDAPTVSQILDISSISTTNRTINTNNLFKSLDTRICILPHSLKIRDNYVNAEEVITTNIKSIHLRVTYLKNILIELSKSNNFTFNNIITTIINDINRATADEIKLEYYPDEDAGYYTIISNSSFEIEPETRNNLLSLKIYERSAVGSIVEEVNIDTTIDSKVANTIAIASLGQPLNEIPNEAFGLLKFNKNVRSRLNISEIIESESDLENEIRNRLQANILSFNVVSNNLLDFTNDSKINFDKDDTFVDLIQTYKQIKTDIINLSLLNKNTDTIPRNTPLIPVLYNFSMPGISGLYNTSVLKIVDERLPDIYKTTNSYFIITGIKHTINNREWKTSVKTNFQLS